MIPLTIDLQLGSTGPQVSEVQMLLTQRGYSPGPIDGIFGAETKVAVQRFQSDRGFTIDGIVGPVTWAALHGSLPAIPPPAPVTTVKVLSPPTTVTLLPGQTAKFMAGTSPVTLMIGGIGLLTLVSIAFAKPRRTLRRRKK